MEKTWLTNQQAFIDTNLKVYLPVVLLPGLLGMTVVFEVTGGGCRGLRSRVEKNLVRHQTNNIYEMHLQNWYSFRKKSAKFAVKGLSLSQSYKTK